MQKLQELEDLHSRMESQEDALNLQLSLCCSTLGSTVVALLQLSSDLMAFFASKGYETPQHITDILTKMAVGSTHMEAPTLVSPVGLASPTQAGGMASARVRDWVSATSSQSCPSAGTFSHLLVPHRFDFLLQFCLNSVLLSRSDFCSDCYRSTQRIHVFRLRRRTARGPLTAR